MGGAFDTSTGVFTCPVTGYYMFHTSLTSPDGTGLLVEMYRGDTYLITIDATDVNNRQSTNLVNTECTSGRMYADVRYIKVFFYNKLYCVKLLIFKGNRFNFRMLVQ